MVDLINNEHVHINDEYESLVDKIIDQLEEIKDLIDKDFETQIDKYDDVICDLLVTLQDQVFTIILNNLVINELKLFYFERYLK